MRIAKIEAIINVFTVSFIDGKINERTILNKAHKQAVRGIDINQNKYMKFGYVGNRWMILLFIFLIAIYASSPLPHFELENKFANIISLLCSFHFFSAFQLNKLSFYRLKNQ